MTLQKRPCLCAYRILKLSSASFSDQPLNKIHLPNDRRKFNLDLTWNRMKVLYQFQEYIKMMNMNSQNSPKDWINVFRKLPSLFSAESPKKPFQPTLTPIPEVSDSETQSKPVNEAPVNVELPDPVREQPTSETKEQSYNIPLISSWKKQNAGPPQPPKQTNSIPKWRNNVTVTSSTTVLSRVKHLLVLIDYAETVQSRVKRIEDLIAYLIKHREAKLIAVKEGAIQKLLRIRTKTKDFATHKVLREAFALLGHIDPLPCKGIRILSIDGGGIRGIAVIEMLRRIEELTGKRIYELFDYIVGVSTGSILVSFIGTPQGISLDEALATYTDFGTKLFTQSPLWGVGNLMWGRAYYDTNMFEQHLKRFVGETPLIKTNRDANCPKLATVSTIMNQCSVMPFVFRNYAIPCNRQSQYLGSCEYSIFQAVRASVAAPTFFEEFCLDGMIHQDGGILMNNPCAVAIHEAKLLWPNSEIQCVVSCGTGRHAPLSVAAESIKTNVNPSSVSWRTVFNKILESATDTEGVHTMLNDLLPPNVYFRFNPYLTDLIAMHENKAPKISQLREETNLYIRRNEEKFVDAATSLLIKRTATQRVQDFLEEKCYEYGVKNTACKL